MQIGGSSEIRLSRAPHRSMAGLLDLNKNKVPKKRDLGLSDALANGKMSNINAQHFNGTRRQSEAKRKTSHADWIRTRDKWGLGILITLKADSLRRI